MRRREFIAGGAALGAYAALRADGRAVAPRPPKFLFMADHHVESEAELRAAAAESGAPAGVIGLMVIGLMSMESPGLTVQRSIGLTGQTVGGAFSIQHCRVAA